MNGEWLIRQFGFEQRLQTERVTVEDSMYTRSGSEPTVDVGPNALIAEYSDGRILIYPWNNILRAEYRPHNEP